MGRSPQVPAPKAGAGVPDTLAKLLAEQLGIGLEEITLGAKVVDDLGADELDTVELVMEAEKLYGIECPDSDFESDWIETGTVRDLIAYFERQGAKL